MALCQPATAIALICSSSLRCPSPWVYIAIPLSSLYSIHSLFTTFPLCVQNVAFVYNAYHCTYNFLSLVCVRQIVGLCFNVGDFFGTWRNALSDWPVGNYCGTNLFHRDKRRKTKRALSLEKACVVLINFYQPPSCLLRFTSLIALCRLRLFTRTHS